MKNSIPFYLVFMTVIFLLVFSCTKEQNETLTDLQVETEPATRINDELLTNGNASQRGKDSHGCWETCPGTIVPATCDCTAFNNSMYRVEIIGIVSNVAVTLSPAFTACNDNYFTQDGTYTVALDTERFNVATEASEKEGVEWTARLGGTGQPPTQSSAVSVRITSLDNTCTQNNNFLFSLDLSTGPSSQAEFCLQCSYSDPVIVEGN